MKNKKPIKNNDEMMSYEQLMDLNKKLGKAIEGLEKQLETPSDTEKCIEPAKPTYEELFKQVERLNKRIFKLNQENNALRYSLTQMYTQLENSQAREEIWEEDYYKEHSRAEKLYDELNNK